MILNQVDFAYKMYSSGDFIRSGSSFNGDGCGPRTIMYMDYIFNDLGENHWGSLFGALSTFSKNVVMEEAVKNGASEEPRAPVPLPPSD